MRRAARAALVACCLAIWLVPAAADTLYAVELRLAGIKNSALSDALTAASQLAALKDRPPPSLAALQRRADEDMPRLEAVMKAEGYWQAQARYAIDEAAKPVRVTVTVSAGPLYHLAKVAFLLPSGAPAPLLDRLGPAAVGLIMGGPARSDAVEAANARIVTLYAQNGRPFASVTDRRVVVDTGTFTMSVIYTVEPGAEARFGAFTITGLHSVARDFVTRHIAWKAGAPYDEKAVQTTQQDLVRSGLFSTVRITHADAPDAAGAVAMTIDLIEGPPHSVGAGAGYNTNIGLGAQAFWEDRNLLGEGENLRLTAGVAQRQVGVAADFRRPDFLLRKQDLVADAEILQETTDAYESRRERVYVGVEELMWPPYTLGAGTSIERTYLTNTVRDENYLLLGLPLSLKRDTTDDLLDPTLGTRLTLAVTPYHGLLAPELDFVSSRVEERAYQRIGDSNKYVLACYAALGSVVGTSLDALPADKRLYAGGAGSVRGYGYQRAGPLDASNVPIGGRSSLEFGGELRYRVTETIGIVPFFDAGNVFASNLPDRADLFYSAGLGLRYYTAIGPVRLDLAFPIDKRGSDSAIQIYISVGQAF